MEVSRNFGSLNCDIMKLIGEMQKSKFSWALLVIIASIPTFFTLARPGFFPMQDDQHVFRLFEMQKCFEDGQFPCRWVPDAGYGYGYPLFNFYPPFIYYLGNLIHFLGPQFIDVIKIIIILGFVFGGVGMFFLTREFFGNFAGFVSSILYLYSPYKAQQVYVRGALSEFWAGVFFPLILFASYKLIRTKDKRYFVLFSVFLGLLLVTHNILSYLFLPILAFWILFWVRESNFNKQNIKILTKSVFLALGLSSFFLLPVLLEKKFAHVETLLGGYFDYRQHFVTIKQLFFSNSWGYGSSTLGPVDDLSLSVGIVHWILGLSALVLAVIKFKKDKNLSILILGFLVIEFFILFLMHQRSSFVWSLFTPLSWAQFPWRFLALSSFILSLLAGYVTLSLKKVKYVFGLAIVATVFMLHSSFFVPKDWFLTTDNEELTGQKWERQLTSSIFDYLPIYASLPPEFRAPDLPQVLSGKVEFKDYYKGSNFQTARVTALQDSRVRLPLFDFPGMVVYLNNQAVSHTNNDCTGEKFCSGLIVFDLPKGEHNLEVKLKNTSVRLWGNLISTISLGLVLVLLLKRNNAIFKK